MRVAGGDGVTPDVQFCEQFCEPNTTPIGPDGTPGTEDWKGECGQCAMVMTWLCRDVLPGIRKHGYYVAAGSPIEVELAAMQQQAGLSDRLAELLAEFLGGAE
jgi:hypothetical protein